MDRKIIDRIVVEKEPDFAREAVNFTSEYFAALSEGKEFFDQASLVKEERYDEDASVVDERYSQLLDYLSSIRKAMPHLWQGKEDLLPLFMLNSENENYDSFAESLFFNIPSGISLADLDVEKFTIAAKFALIDLIQDDLDILAASPEELAEIFGDYQTSDLDFELLIEQVQKLEFTDSQKIFVLDFFINISDYYEKIISSLIEVEKLCKLSFEIIRPLFEEKIKNLDSDSGLKHLNEQWLKRFDFEQISFRRGEDIHLYVSIVRYNGLWLRYSQNFNQELVIGLGLIFAEMLEVSSKSDQRQLLDQKQLNALSDNTRYQVIQILAERPHYAQEIADKLGITAATLSHHMQILINALLIKIRTEGRKVFYRLQTSEIKRLAYSLMSFAEAVERGEHE